MLVKDHTFWKEKKNNIAIDFETITEYQETESA